MTEGQTIATIGLQECFTVILPIVGSAIIVFWVTRRTIKASRVSNIHSEMCTCLTDTMFIAKEILYLLEEITKGHFYIQKIPRGEIDEKNNAYSRYWGKIDDFSEQSKILSNKQQLFLPKNLLAKADIVRKKLNEGKRLAESACPVGKIFPDTPELKKVVKEAKAAYQDLKKEACRYLGTEKLKPITKE